MATCLDIQEMRRLHAGELPPQRAADARLHLSGCAACARQHDDLLREHQSWVAWIQAAGPPDRRGVDPLSTGLDAAIRGYRVIGEIGRGGQGVVYRALQESTNRQVAVKVLLDGRFAAPATRRRFEREIEIVAALKHPDIVAVFDSGETEDGRRCCVMDLVEGVPLDQYVTERGLGLRERLALFARVCDAVNHAHQKGVIHRDLKPSNVLVDCGGAPKVLDFGLAKPLSADAAAATLTGALTGTLAYMSPEAARGASEQMDVRSDVYALGVILYQLLTGRFPYPVDEDATTVLRHIAETPPQPLVAALSAARAGPSNHHGIVPGDVSSDLQTLVGKALAKETDRRYQTAGELARDVRHSLAGEPLDARRDSVLYVLRKTLRKHRAGACFATAFLLLLVGSVAALAVMYARQLRLRHEAQQAEAVAQHRFEQVRELARAFLFDFDPLINRLPGTTAARELLVAKGLSYLDSLAREAGDDPALLHELAEAYLRIGDVQGDITTSNRGLPEVALDSYRKAQEALARIKGVPAVAGRETRRLRSLALLKTADTLWRLERLEESDEACAAALVLADELVREEPDDESLLDHLAAALERAGGVQQRRGALESAVEHYRRVLEISERLTAARPDDLWRRRGIGTVRTKLAHVHVARGDLELALAEYERFLDIARQLLDAHPDNIVARRDVLVGHQWRGILLTQQQRYEEAIAALRQSAAVGEAWLAADPESSEARLNLATTYVKLVEAELPAGRRPEARASAKRNRELSAEQARRTPNSAPALRGLGVAVYKQAEVELSFSEDESVPAEQRIAHCQEARAYFVECRELFLDLRARGLLAPSDAGVPEELASDAARCEAAIQRLRSREE